MPRRYIELRVNRLEQREIHVPGADILGNPGHVGLDGSGNLTLLGCRAVTDRKPYRHRFPLSVIGYALRLYHRFPLSQRDVQELLHERGVQVSHETLRQWNIKFAPLLTEELRYREPRRGSRWHLDEVCVKVGGVKHWLWRAVDEYGDVLDILLQEHRDTQAAKSFFVRLLGEYDVPEVIHTDKLWSYGAALREIPCSTTWSTFRSFPPPAVTIWWSNLIDPPGSKNEANWASSAGNEHKNSSPCTPESRTSIDTREPPFPPPSDEAINPQLFSAGEGDAAGGLILKPPAELLRPHSG